MTIVSWTFIRSRRPSIRDAWLAGERGKATVIAKTICPYTWLVLLAACEVERGLSPERHDLVVGPVLDSHRDGES